MWDPAVYRRFGAERSRPFVDLVQRVGADRPREVVDLGCATGELTRTLAERWPGARVSGLDSSREMVAKAVGDVRLGDIADWRPGPETDVVVTNAALQWVDGHRRLLPEWIAALPAGAWFAMQVPGNFDSPGHRVVREMAPELNRDDPVGDPVDYARLAIGAGAAADAWETTYLHLLPDDGPDHPVLRWMEGTALRPIRAALGEAEWKSFREDFARRIATVHPARDGLVAFPFRRIFLVAHK
jgi:trans-aconitate 2-methyltransferase